MYLDPQGMRAFFRRDPSKNEIDPRLQDEGASTFLRLNDGERMRLLFDLIRAWLEDEPLNRSMASGAFRCGWDSEPYFGGARLGSYISHLAMSDEFNWHWSVDDFVEEWGYALMKSEERDHLDALAFPLTVFRGGVGEPEGVALGISWTLDRDTASFYANEWPKRWGDTRRPVSLCMSVERSEVAAFLNDRKEAEFLILPTKDRKDAKERLGASRSPCRLIRWRGAD